MKVAPRLLLLCVSLCAPLGVVTRCLARDDARTGVTLAWEAPPGCPERARVLSVIQRNAEVRSGLERQLALNVAITVAREGNYWRAQVRMSGSLQGERALEGDSCDALVDASAWIVGQAVRSLDGSPPQASPSTPREPAAKPSSAADAPRETEPRSRSIALGAGVWLDSAALPDWTLGFGLQAGVQAGAWRFELRPRLFLPRAVGVDLPGSPDASASFALIELPLQVCYGVPLGRLRLGPCLGAAPGLMWGSGDGWPKAQTRLGSWVALEAALAAVLGATERTRVRLELGLARPVWAPHFLAGNASAVHRTAALVLRAGLGVDLLF